MNLKKGAMFGLESRTLRKQSGRLFLESFRRLTFRLVGGQQATRLQTTKGAMFGLDARIALAIFGALSVISGAALYSAIQDARATSTLATLNELSKSSEQYLLDTGAKVPLVAGENINFLSLKSDNSVAGWNGPYSSLNIVSSSSIVYGDINIYAKIRKISTWTTAQNAFPDSCTDGDNDCAEWFFLYTNEAGEFDYIRNIYNTLDQKVDNGDGVDAGKIRLRDGVSASIRMYYLSKARL